MAFHHKNSIRPVIMICLIITFVSCSKNSNFQPTASPSITPTLAPLSLPSGSGGGVIAFASDRDRGQMDLYLINADGSELTQITHSRDNIISPSWSPDGLNLAFLVSKFDQLQLGFLSIASALADPLTNHAIILVEDPVEASPPTWSPDGTTLFYAAAEGDNIDLYKIDIDGNNKAQITNTDYREKHPAISPDGTKLVYSSNQSGSFDLYLINDFVISDNAMQTPIQLTFGEGDEVLPAWSPDSSQILFTTTENGNKDISIIDLESGITNTIKESPADEWKGSWAPDSSQVVFSYFNFDNALNDLVVYSVESETSFSITEDNFDNWWPAWKP